MVQVNKAPVLPASRRPVRSTALSSTSLPGTSRGVNGLSMATTTTGLATTQSMTAVPVVRSPSYTPLHSRARSGSRSAASFTPLPVSNPPSGQNLASWTPSPVTIPGNLGLEAIRARSVTHQAQVEEETRYNAVPLIQQPAQQPEEMQRYAAGVDVEIGEHRFRCMDVLGKGSYSEVWRGEVLKGGSGVKEVALKEVRCGNQVELQQAIFEVQVLLALERSSEQGKVAARVPRCISYKVDPCSDGWKVRTAMTVVPGESLDVFIRHKPVPGVTRESAIERSAILSSKLIRDIGPTLELLAPIAWHRDVNSHNILIDGQLVDANVEELESNTSFWLIDFGLAVDSQSWVTMHGRWRTEDIGGDSRYWPPSSWIMHLLGPEGFGGRQELCEQYQTRLDIHGLGVTALELLCTIAQASPESEGTDKDRQAAWEDVFLAWHRYREDVWRWWAAVYSVFSAGGDIAPVQAQMVRDRVIEQLIVLLANIRSTLRHTAQFEKESIGLVLTTIADMLDEGCSFELIDLGVMLGDRPAAPAVFDSSILSQQSDGGSKGAATYEGAGYGTPANTVSSDSRLPVPPRVTGPAIHSSRASPSSRSLSPQKVQDRRLGASSSIPARCASPPPPPSVQAPLPWPVQEMQVRHTSPAATKQVPVVVRQLSPVRGRSTGGNTPGVGTSGMAAQARAVSEQPAQTQLTPSLPGPLNSIRTPRDAQRSFVAPSSADRAMAGGTLGLEPGVTRYKSTSGIPSAGFFSMVNRAQSIEPLRLSAAESASIPSMERSVSPCHWAATSLSRQMQRSRSLDRVGPATRHRSIDRQGSQLPMPPLQSETLSSQTQAQMAQMAAAQQMQWNGVMLPTAMLQQRQGDGTSSALPSHRSGAVGSRHSFGQGCRSGTPQNSPSVSTRGGRQLSVDARNSLQQRAYMGQVLPPAPFDEGNGPGQQRGVSMDARGTRRGMSVDPMTLGEGPLLARGSPRPGGGTDPLRLTATGPSGSANILGGTGSITGPAHLPRMLPTPWLPPPRELVTSSKKSLSGGDPSEASFAAGYPHSNRRGGAEPAEVASMANRLSEAMAGLTAVAQGMNPSGSQTPGGFDSVAVSGDGDLSAGPPYPLVGSASRSASAMSPHSLRASVEISSMSAEIPHDPAAGSPIDHVRRGVDSQELLKERMRSLEAHGDEHEKLRERIKNLEESLQKLGRESLERAKLGMEKLAEKYFPKVRPATAMGPYAAPASQYGSNTSLASSNISGTAIPGMMLPSGASAGITQVRPTYATTSMPVSANLAMPMSASASTDVSGA